MSERTWLTGFASGTCYLGTKVMMKRGLSMSVRGCKWLARGLTRQGHLRVSQGDREVKENVEEAILGAGWQQMGRRTW